MTEVVRATQQFTEAVLDVQVTQQTARVTQQFVEVIMDKNPAPPAPTAGAQMLVIIT